MRGRVAYLCLQATSEGQASHAHVHEIGDGLRALGWEVDLFEPSYAHGSPPGALGRILEFLRIQRRLIRSLHAYDLVYIRAHQLAFPTAFAAHRRGIPVVQECNGTFADLVTAWPAAAPVAGPLNRLQERQYRIAETIITVTSGLQRWVEAQSGNHQVHVVPNGANTSLFRPDAPRPAGLPERYVVFFGALTPWSGVRTLLAAARSPVWPEGVAVVIAGDGILSHVVDREAEANRSVVALGRRPYAEMGGLVAGAAASIVPTDASVRPDADPSPVKLYESLAAGTPVVVSHTLSQASEVLDTGVGLTFEEGDAHALASAVSSLLAERRRALGMGDRARTLVLAEHSWSIRARRTSEILETLVRRPDA